MRKREKIPEGPKQVSALNQIRLHEARTNSRIQLQNTFS